jgi:predicted nucleic acid-binding protein
LGVYEKNSPDTKTRRDKQAWDMHKRRDFQNDALIALTARRHGATVVTANYSDFELLRSELRLPILAAK